MKLPINTKRTKYLFLKKLYWELMIEMKKQKDEKSYNSLKEGWEEIEKISTVY